MDAESILAKLGKMLEAKVGGYSIKRVLLIILFLNMVAMLWVFTNDKNFMLVLTAIISLITLLLGYNNAEKKIMAKADLDMKSLELGKDPNKTEGQ